MFFACAIWCLADVSSVSPLSEQTARWYNLLCQSPTAAWQCVLLEHLNKVNTEKCDNQQDFGRRKLTTRNKCKFQYLELIIQNRLYIAFRQSKTSTLYGVNWRWVRARG